MDSDALDAGGNPVAMAPGGSFAGIVDIGGILRGGHTDVAVIQPSQVASNGDFVHWTTEETPDLFASGSAVDMAYGASKVVALMPHNNSSDRSNIVMECSFPVDGAKQVDIIITTAGVIKVNRDGLELVETAPGWTVEDVVEITHAPLSISPDVKEMKFHVPELKCRTKCFQTPLAPLPMCQKGQHLMWRFCWSRRHGPLPNDRASRPWCERSETD
ncbi:MAG: hypothetical protein Ct9H300mP11_21410 [Chloroflexota bacterium]|nr:MAG: hypothetical protein Ct9H300mP11_21410 [Chloroflexota bacterium]